MLPTTSLLQLALCLSTFGRLAIASPGHLPRLADLIARQDDASATESNNIIEPTGSSGDSDSSSSGTTAQPKATKTTDSPKSTGADLNTAEPESSGASQTNTGSSKTKSGSPKQTTFPPDAPAGGVEMLTPSTVAGTTVLYKIGDDIEWAWNYTSLLGTPTAIDVLVSCATASETWTLSSNMSFATSVNFTWDTSKQENDVEQPLLTELYTLIVKDSDAEIGEPAQPGYLGAYSGFTFGLYAPQPYTPMANWTCLACDNAATSLNSQAVGLACFMSLITFFSFTWFVTGFGLH